LSRKRKKIKFDFEWWWLCPEHVNPSQDIMIQTSKMVGKRL